MAYTTAKANTTANQMPPMKSKVSPAGLAGRNGTIFESSFLSVRVLQIEDSEGAQAARLSAMRALGALTETNPDVLEGQGCKELFSGLGCGERAMEEASLEALLNCCVRHEHNRQNLVSLPS